MLNWNQRAHRSINRLVDNDALDIDRVQVVNRPLYFNQYRIALHASPTVNNWVDFHELQEGMVSHLGGLEYRLVSSSSALYFNVYTNDYKVVDALGSILDEIEINSIYILDPKWHEVRQTKVRNKGNYYHKYPYRVRVSSPSVWDPEQYRSLLTGDWYIGGSFLYLTNVRDVILIKLVHEGEILDIAER